MDLQHEGALGDGRPEPPLEAYEAYNDDVVIDFPGEARSWRPGREPEKASSRNGPMGEAARAVVEDFDTLEPGSLTWVVKYLWPAVGVGFVAGPSMAGKSFWVIDGLGRVCRGLDVLGRRSKACGVLYLAAEGQHGVRKRIAALRSRIGTLGGRFKFYGGQTDLTDEAKVAKLRETIDAAKAELEAAGHALGIIVVDTLAAAAPGVDENTAADMGGVLGELQALAGDLQCFVLVIAHTGKNEERGIRGWSGQLANADAVITLTEPNGEIRVGTVTKVKDGPSGDRFAFALEVVDLGLDEDLDPVTTCVVVEREAPEASNAVGRPSTRVGGTAALIMSAFTRVLEDNPQTINARGANGAKGVYIKELRQMAYGIGVGPASAEVPDDADDVERKKILRAWGKQRAADFGRGMDALLGQKKLRKEGDLVWEIDAKKVIR
jgi:hypothetical protein